MKTTIGTQDWYDFDPAKGSRQKRPPLRKPVLVQCRSLDPSFPDPILVGYRKDGAGDNQSPFFVRPGGIGCGQVYRWCDCLPDGFQMPPRMYNAREVLNS